MALSVRDLIRCNVLVGAKIEEYERFADQEERLGSSAERLALWRRRISEMEELRSKIDAALGVSS